jgi:predicted ArsR family transcriptional regulator
MAKQTRRQTKVTDEELNGAVYCRTPAGTTEIAEIVGISRQATTERLKQLEAEGIVWSKKIGPTRIWIHECVIPQP